MFTGLEANSAPTRDRYSADSTCAPRNAPSRGVTNSYALGRQIGCERARQNQPEDGQLTDDERKYHQPSLLSIMMRKLYRNSVIWLIFSKHLSHGRRAARKFGHKASSWLFSQKDAHDLLQGIFVVGCNTVED